MLAPLLLTLAPAPQEPAFDPMAYVREHRAADAALVAGSLEEARAGFERCLAMSPRNATIHYALACCAARRNDELAALTWLARAVDSGFADARMARWDLDLSILRDREGFRDVIQRMNALDATPAWPNAAGKPRVSVDSEGRAVMASTVKPPPGEPIEIFHKNPDAFVCDLAMDARGELIAVACSDGIVRVLDGATGTHLRQTRDFESEAWALDFHPAGKQVAILTWDGKLHLWNVDGGSEPRSAQALEPLPSADAKAHQDSQPAHDMDRDFTWPFGALVRYDPTGERLLVAGRRRGISLWSVSGEKLRTWDGPGGFFSIPVAWSHDGKRIAMAASKDLTFFDGATGEAVGEPLSTPASSWSLAFDPTGRWLATGHEDRKLRLWDLNDRSLAFEHVFEDPWTDEISVNVVRFSPDGRHVAAGTDESGYVHVLEVATGKRVADFSWSGGRMGEPQDLRWSRDSKRLWFAFCSGVLDVEELRLDPLIPPSTPYDGSPPRVSESERTVAHSMWSIASIDASSGLFLWRRPLMPSEGNLWSTAIGYFTTDLDSLDDFKLWKPDDQAGRPLSELAEKLFDPKRVRAARAGVELMPVKL